MDGIRTRIVFRPTPYESAETPFLNHASVSFVLYWWGESNPQDDRFELSMFANYITPAYFGGSEGIRTLNLFQANGSKPLMYPSSNTLPYFGVAEGN